MPTRTLLPRALKVTVVWTLLLLYWLAPRYERFAEITVDAARSPDDVVGAIECALERR